MPIFQTNQTPPIECRTMELVRTPARGELQAVITSADLIGCPTHFYGGRTVPHEAEACPACADGHGWRWHGYVSCLLRGRREHVLFEFTAQASDALRDERKQYGTLRGCWFRAKRLNDRPNGRVLLQVMDKRPTDIVLPPAPDIPKQLCKIWGINPEAESNAPDNQAAADARAGLQLKIDRRRAQMQSSNGRLKK